ncbi:unnamed protein product [Calypogeia fissa]
MADKKQQPAVPMLSTEQGAGGSIVPLHHEDVVSIDLERLSADLALDLTTGDIELQSQSAAGPGVEKELQSPVENATSTSGSGSSSGNEMPTGGSSPMSKWRWIGQKELQYLVTNRRTPPPRPPESPARTTNLGTEAKSSSSVVVPIDTPNEALEHGAFLRVVTESGDRIPAALEGGNEGGRQRIAHILLPTTDESPERDQPCNPDHSAPPIRRELSLVTASAAATAAATAGGKKRKVSSVVGDGNSSSLSHDLEKGKVCSDAMGDREEVGEGAAEAASYQHEDDDDGNEPLCRVCHMSTVKADVITLGCACKDDLGRAHRGCAETWFQVRGNRQCEICGQIAQNVQLLEPMDDSVTNTSTQDPVITVGVHHPATICWQNRPIRNFLLVFLVAAFLIPWLFRFAYYNH